MADNTIVDCLYNSIGGGPWGYDPHPYEHDAFFGWRAIWVPKRYIAGKIIKEHIEYLQDRSSCYGERFTLELILKWWSKRGGVESKWLKAEDYEAQPWVYRDDKLGNTAYVRKTDGYVYISLYHDEKKKEDKHD